MTGTYDRGSLVFDEVVPVKSLKVGDVITYKPPRGSGPEGLVTHRISSIGKDPKNGARVFRTKGDANKSADPWTFILPDKRQARVVAGSRTWASRSPPSPSASSACSSSGVPAALIALIVLGGVWREAGREADAQAADAAAPPPDPRRLTRCAA